MACREKLCLNDKKITRPPTIQSLHARDIHTDVITVQDLSIKDPQKNGG